MDPVTALSGLLAFLPARYAGLFFALCGLCAALSAVVRPPRNATLARLWSIVVFLGLNFGHARNANQAGPAAPVAVAAGKGVPVPTIFALLLAAAGLAACATTPTRKAAATQDFATAYAMAHAAEAAYAASLGASPDAVASLAQLDQVAAAALAAYAAAPADDARAQQAQTAVAALVTYVALSVGPR